MDKDSVSCIGDSSLRAQNDEVVSAGQGEGGGSEGAVALVKRARAAVLRMDKEAMPVLAILRSALRMTRGVSDGGARAVLRMGRFGRLNDPGGDDGSAGSMDG
jgi:hypothetical protein